MKFREYLRDTKEEGTLEGNMNNRIRKMGEDGYTLVDIMVAVAVIGCLYAVTFSVIFNLKSKDNNRWISIAQGVEAWSIANPADPISYESSFPLRDFALKSGYISTTSLDYTLERVSTADDTLLCFTENKDGFKVRAYSYQSNKLVDRNLCNP